MGFASSGATDAAYRPMEIDLKQVLPPRFALQYSTVDATRGEKSEMPGDGGMENNGWNFSCSFLIF